MRGKAQDGTALEPAEVLPPDGPEARASAAEARASAAEAALGRVVGLARDARESLEGSDEGRLLAALGELERLAASNEGAERTRALEAENAFAVVMLQEVHRVLAGSGSVPAGFVERLGRAVEGVSATPNRLRDKLRLMDEIAERASAVSRALSGLAVPASRLRTALGAFQDRPAGA